MAVSNSRIGPFEIIRKLPDQGWQGVVYEVRCVEEQFPEVTVGNRFALKVMSVPEGDKDFERRLKQRTDSLTHMRHPNMVRYYGSFSDKGGVLSDQVFHVVIMEYLEGTTLDKRLKKAPFGLDVDEGLRIIRESLAVLIYCAENQVIHRDIKPSNIFICRDGSIRLIDFEIARHQGGTVSGSVQGNLRGTFDYMAPDFLDPEFHGDECSDVFSLAVCLHETLSGRTPYQTVKDEARQAEFVFYNRWFGNKEGVISISSRIQALVPRLSPILQQGLAPDRAQRIATFKDFELQLRKAKPHMLANGSMQYMLLQLIGQGGFGKVYKGRCLADQRDVAIKCLLRSEYADRFMREARVLKQLKGVPVVGFTDFFSIAQVGGEQFFLVMDYLPGMPGNSLRDRVKKGDVIPHDEALKAFVRFSQGLEALHAEGIYHRDIKPANLYLPYGLPENACIMDLGVARDASGTVTHGQVPGSLDYMPPEVVFGTSRGDAGMDIFALGLCLFEALTATHAYPRLPPGDQALIGLSQRARNKERPNLDHPLINSRPAVRELLCMMTEPEVEKRIQSIGLVRVALERLLLNNSQEASESKGLETRATMGTMSSAKRFAHSPTHPPVKSSVKPLTHPPHANKRVERLIPFALVAGMLVVLGGLGFTAWSIRQPVSEHVSRATQRVKNFFYASVQGKQVTRVTKETCNELLSTAALVTPGDYIALTSRLVRVGVVGRERIATLTNQVPADVVGQWMWMYERETQAAMQKKLLELKGEAARLAENKAQEALRLYGAKKGDLAAEASDQYLQWCRVMGLEARHSNTLAEAQDAFQQLTQPAEFVLANAQVLESPPVSVEMSKDRGQTWKPWPQGQRITAVLGEEVWARFSRADYEPIALVKEKVRPGQTIEIKQPEASAWRAKPALTKLLALHEQVTQEAWEAAAGMTNVVAMTFQFPAHAEEAQQLMQKVRSYFAKEAHAQLEESERQEKARQAELARAEELKQIEKEQQAQVTRQIETERQAQVARQVEAVRVLTRAFDEGQPLVLPPKFVWPHPLEQVAADPIIKKAGSVFAGVLSNRLQQACKDEPLDTRAARLMEAQLFLNNQTVVNVLGTEGAATFSKQVATARDVFILRLKNLSGLAVTVEVSGQHVQCRVDSEELVRLTGKVDKGIARVSGYSDQTLPVAWLAGGGQVIEIPRFDPRPVALTVEAVSGVDVILAGSDKRKVLDGPGTVNLLPGEYTCTFTRPDYEQQIRTVMIRINDQAQRVSSGEWQPSQALRRLEQVEKMLTAGDQLETLISVAEKMTEIGELTDKKHEQRKEQLEERLVKALQPIAEKYMYEVRDWLMEKDRIEFQVADPSTGKMRKTLGNVPLGLGPERPLMPAWVISKFPAEVQVNWQRDGRDDTYSRIIEHCQTAHGVRYLDGLYSPNYLPFGVCNELAKAVALGYSPNRYDLSLAEFALQACERDMAVKLEMSAKNKKIKIDTSKLDEARRDLEKIRSAMRKGG